MKLVVMLCAALFAQVALAEKMNSIYEIPLKDIRGEAMTLKPHAGKVLLIVNVASECGYTGQYAGLEALYKKYKDQGLVIMGVPCNQFGGQEPGNESAILQFCQSNYGVTFPLTSKVDVKGAKQHPLFAALTGKDSPEPGPIKWNFEKILLSRDGKVVKRFDAGTEPDSAELTGAIEAALAAK
jgi:glutathione peroxidase